jgi:hypothetical protein
MRPLKITLICFAFLLLAGAAMLTHLPAAAQGPQPTPTQEPQPTPTQEPQPTPTGLSFTPHSPVSGSSMSATAYGWYDGVTKYSSINNCLFGYVENGAGTYVGYWASNTYAEPETNIVYYLHVVAMTVGNACSGIYGVFDIALPANTSLAISSEFPLRCFLGGSEYISSNCPQTLPASSWNSGFYNIPTNIDPYAWPMPAGWPVEFLIPVTTSAPISGSTFQAKVWTMDGQGSPWLNPTYGIYVFPGFAKSGPANGATNQSVTPTLSWGASTAAVRYEYCIDTSNNNTCNASWISAGTATSKKLSALTAGTKYYWQARVVKPEDIFEGNGGNWWNFTTASTQTFADVPPTHSAYKFIEILYANGITSGCSQSPLKYCPSNPVTRAQMAVFLLRAKHGSSYAPPAATGIFADVSAGNAARAWIEQLYNENITSGCSQSPLKYCPSTSVTRAQMAVFLTKTFNLE